ncbi:hypothetical protein [Rhizobium sp. TRM95796]|uniref:hypothetical protein n=2 Tax=unclassified Rhizobium TaxID=2613769 RepID=UPI0021E7B741|nr:hypothetical protein [Rhizobium sp. TRM95796]MCV3766898.1 hypothetical protein [Rhizobium sp. TRM95796]
MRYQAWQRVLSASFERQPNEHADVILSSGNRLSSTRAPRLNLFTVGVATAFGLAIGAALEAYRRFILPDLVGLDSVPPLSVILLQLLPFLLLISALILGRAYYLEGLKKLSLASEIAPGAFIDIDVYETGVETSSGETTIWMPWTSIREINVGKKRIELVGDGFTAYFPERAFSDKAAYSDALLTFSKLHRAARKASDQRLEPAFDLAPAE